MDADINRELHGKLAAHAGQSGFRMLGSGLDAFVARAALSHIAERSIDAQYYLFHDDLTGRLLIYQLIKAAERGVRVRILTNSLASTDVGLVHAGYVKYRKKLLRAGVELYEMNKQRSHRQRNAKKGGYSGSGKASLHTKSFIFDRREVFVGSLNLDPRAVVHNTEIGMVLDSREIAVGMADWFDHNIGKVAFRLELQKGANGQEKIVWHGLENGQPRIFTVDPYTSVWRRMGIRLMSLLPIKSQL